MNKMYISGSSGMIGRSIVATLRSMGESCIELGRAEYCHIYLNLDNVDSFNYDLIENGSRFLFLSAISSPDHCESHPDLAWRVNVENTSKFIKKLLDKNVFVLFASSDVVYEGGGVINTENSNCFPVGVYAKCKFAIEKMFCENLNFHTMRLSYVMGPGDKFLNYLEKCHFDGTPAEVFHPFSRNIISLKDVVDFCIGFLIEKRVYPPITNLCGDVLISRLELAGIYSINMPIDIKIVEPNPSFFSVRQKIISCKSLYLYEILGRHPIAITVN